jgi:predicted AAA+ superfamily ATPase
MASQNLGGHLHYWRTPAGTEVDFVWTRAARAVGIEVKAATTWRREYGAALKGLIDEGVLKTGYGVYTGSAELKDGPLHIWPIMRFLRELAMGNVLE